MEVALNKFEELSWRTMKSLSEDRLCSAWGANQASAEFMSEVLSLESICSENVKHHSNTSSLLFITCNLFSNAASMPDCVVRWYDD
jgi:hypothetical protein